LNILRACEDPNLFGPWFRNPSSWRPWFAFLAALFALPMDDEQTAIFRHHAQRDDVPSTPQEEAWLVVGRRGGKSFIMALVAVYLATFREYRTYLQPGERATVAIIAADRKQSRIILRYVRGLLLLNPMLKRMVQRETADGFDLSNGVTIEVGTASFRSTRGYSFAACMIDEIAYFHTGDDVANPDTEILTALRPGMASIPGSMLICASSPYARRGELWDAYRKYFGQNGGPLVWQATTREMNPSVSQRIVDEALERDPARAAAEFMAEFRSDIEGYVGLEVVTSCTIPGRHELPPAVNTRYYGFTDPSGGSSDSFTLAIAHRDKTGVCILDAVRERKPPFSPQSVVDEFAALLKTYHVSRISGDKYGGEWPRERFRALGITYEPVERSKSDLYREFLPLLNSGKVELLDIPRLATQFTSLERRTARSGFDSIDHAPGAHDDLANAAAGAMVLAAAKCGPMVISEEALRMSKAPGPARRRLHYGRSPVF
jgi:hypothetical protein